MFYHLASQIIAEPQKPHSPQVGLPHIHNHNDTKAKAQNPHHYRQTGDNDKSAEQPTNRHANRHATAMLPTHN